MMTEVVGTAAEIIMVPAIMTAKTPMDTVGGASPMQWAVARTGFGSVTGTAMAVAVTVVANAAETGRKIVAMQPSRFHR
jgi:hypothetical protein